MNDELPRRVRPIHFTPNQLDALRDVLDYVLGSDAFAGELEHLRTGVVDRIRGKVANAERPR